MADYGGEEIDLARLDDDALADLSRRIYYVQDERRYTENAVQEMDRIAMGWHVRHPPRPVDGEPPEWVQPLTPENPMPYPKNFVTMHDGEPWVSTTSNNVWEPGVSGWHPQATDGGPARWVQPSGTHDAYGMDDEVTHVERHWISRRDPNVWEPGTQDSGWDEVIVDEPDPEPDPPEEPEPEPDPDPPVDPDPEPDPPDEPERPEGYVGSWNLTTSYEVGDVVDRDGRYYRCKVAHGAEQQGAWGPPQHAVWDDLGPV